MTEHSTSRLIIMTRYPAAGRVKTRLIPALGAEAAAELQRRMTEYIVIQARKLRVHTDICFTGGTEAGMKKWLGDDLDFSEQGHGGLGERMKRAVDRHFSNGARKVVVVGCDCPDNRAPEIQTCFDALDEHECIIGPTFDGGYYMLGLRRKTPELLANIDWGSDRVLRQTLRAAEDMGLSPHLLAELRDVDLAGDIPEKISVIIPALNEGKMIKDSIASAQSAFNVECLVVDGGSSDGTVPAAKECGAHTLRERPGRALQMNAGAAAAGGDIFLFLHADTLLPDGWDRMVRSTLNDPGVALGAFRFRVRERLRGIGLIEWTTHLRSHYMKRPYGDQAFFMRAATFLKLEGFPDMPVMEDLKLAQKARKLGKVITLKEPALTSGRRWKKLGVFRGSLFNQAVLLGSFFQIPPRMLARFYRRIIN